MSLTGREIRVKVAGHDVAFAVGMGSKIEQSVMKLYVDGAVVDQTQIGMSAILGPTITLRAPLPRKSKAGPRQVVRAVARVAPLGLWCRYEIYVDDVLVKRDRSWFGY
jgi:hypothetical protein